MRIADDTRGEQLYNQQFEQPHRLTFTDSVLAAQTSDIITIIIFAIPDLNILKIFHVLLKTATTVVNLIAEVSSKLTKEFN